MNIRSFFSAILAFILMFFTENTTAQTNYSQHNTWRPVELIRIRLQAQGFKVDHITKVVKKGYLFYLQDTKKNKFIYFIDPFSGNVLEKHPYNYTMPK